MEKNTLAEEYQNLLYGLFQEKLFRLEGQNMSTEKGLIEEFIAKSDLIESAIEVLNEVGKLMASDRRLNNEIEPDKNNSLSE